MKVVQPRTQFDRPESVGTPATPSCCCCCCCCLATVVSTTAMGAITAHHQAKRFNRPSGWAILLALLAVPLGFVATSILGSGIGDGVSAVIGGSVVALVLWYFAFHLAAPESESSAVGRSFKYLVLFGLCFALELVVGFFLVLLYVVPYLIVAGLVMFFAIGAHLKSQRAELPATMSAPPAWQPPPPPPPGTPASRPTTMLSVDQDGFDALGPGTDSSGGPAAWPPRSDYESHSPASSGLVIPTPPTSDVSPYEPPVPSQEPAPPPPTAPPRPNDAPAFQPPPPPRPNDAPAFQPPPPTPPNDAPAFQPPPPTPPVDPEVAEPSSFEPPPPTPPVDPEVAEPSSFEPPPPTPLVDPEVAEPSSFEPPADYQLPGYPTAPPQADGPAPPPSTYRPGNPARHSPPPPATDPIDEQG